MSKKFSPFHWARRFITVLTKARNWTLSWASYPIPTFTSCYLRSIWILSSQICIRLPNPMLRSCQENLQRNHYSTFLAQYRVITNYVSYWITLLVRKVTATSKLKANHFKEYSFYPAYWYEFNFVWVLFSCQQINVISHIIYNHPVYIMQHIISFKHIIVKSQNDHEIIK
jgi:hypothetical protein